MTPGRSGLCPPLPRAISVNYQTSLSQMTSTNRYPRAKLRRGKRPSGQPPRPASAALDDDDWPIDVEDLREALHESEADIAAGRTFSEEEIRARYGIPRSDEG